MKRIINIAIFLIIFSLYFVTFLMIYDNFRERKLNFKEEKALDILEEKIKEQEKNSDETAKYGIGYSNFTIIGRLEVPSVYINTVIIKEYTYSAMNVGSVKTYGVDLNEKGGFAISGHNFRGRSTFFYNIKNLQSGSKIYITDVLGRKKEYKVYSVERNVSPNDTSYMKVFDSYHVTLITCENGGKTRIVVKAIGE